ncbi:unnamed protein product [Linum trigynum]|uniref:Replication factor A C-terminal domain-containing protein n=1 Tax=Linum trigynum TaxID=586398 RepID=A0AAV2D7N2_9ROSI
MSRIGSSSSISTAPVNTGSSLDLVAIDKDPSHRRCRRQRRYKVLAVNFAPNQPLHYDPQTRSNLRLHPSPTTANTANCFSFLRRHQKSPPPTPSPSFGAASKRLPVDSSAIHKSQLLIVFGDGSKREKINLLFERTSPQTVTNSCSNLSPVRMGMLDKLQSGFHSGTVCARISRMWDAINTKTNTLIRLDLILLDAKGNDINVQIPADNVDTMRPLLHEQRVYKFSNFKVERIKMKELFRPVNNPLKIVFQDNTHVEETDDDNSIPPYNFRFIKAAEIPGKVGKPQLLCDTIGYLLKHSNTSKKCNGVSRSVRKELHIQLPEGSKIQVTLWGSIITQFDEVFKAATAAGKSVILIITSTYVKKDAHGVPFFSSSTATKIYGNLDIPEVKAFHVIDEEVPEQQVLGKPPVEYVLKDDPEPKPATIAELAELKNDIDNEGKHFFLKAKIEEVEDNWCYFGCSKCPRKIPEDTDEFWCKVCNISTIKGVPRFRISLYVEDDTGNANLVLLEHEGVIFLKTTAEALLQANNEDMIKPPEYLENLIGKWHKFRIKLTEYNREKNSTNYTIIQVLDDDSVATKTPQYSDNQEETRSPLQETVCSSSHSIQSDLTYTPTALLKSVKKEPGVHTPPGALSAATNSTPEIDSTAASNKNKRKFEVISDSD